MTISKKRYLIGFIALIILFSINGAYIKSNAYMSVISNESEEKDILLRGYNAFSGFEIGSAEAFSMNSYIIDKESEYLEHVQASKNAQDYTYYWNSDNLLELASLYSKDIGFNPDDSIFCLNTDMDQLFSKAYDNNTVSKRYELYSWLIKSHYYVSNLNIQEIRGYLDKGFKTDLYAVDDLSKAVDLYNKYGTHLFTGVVYGGRVNITRTTTTNNTNVDLQELVSLQERTDKRLSYQSSDNSVFEDEDYNESISSNYQFKIYGGKDRTVTSLDQLFGSKGSLYNPTSAIAEWINEIYHEENMVVVALPYAAKTIPLWELLDDSNPKSHKIRQLLLECYLEQCKTHFTSFAENIESETNRKSISLIKVLKDRSSLDFSKKVFEDGQRISKKDLDGLVIEVSYTDGTSAIIDKISDEENLKLIDSVIMDGGHIYLCANDYSYYVDLNLASSETETANDPVLTSIEDVDKKTTKQSEMAQVSDGDSKDVENKSNYGNSMLVMMLAFVIVFFIIIVMYVKASTGKNRKPVLSMVLGYVLFWLVLCIFLTAFIGRKKYERGTADLKQKIIWEYDSFLPVLKDYMLSSAYTMEEKQTEINKYMQEMITYVAGLTDEEVHSYGEYGIYNKNELHTNLEEIGTDRLRIGVRGYLINLNIEDFAKDIDLPDNLKPVAVDRLGRLLFEEYNEKNARYFDESYSDWWTDPTYEDIFAEYEDINVDLLEKWVGIKSYKAEDIIGKFLFFYPDKYNTGFGLTLPFSYMKGDVYFSYHTVIEGADDQELNIMLFFVIPDGLRETKKSFFKAMLLIYLGSAMFFAFLSWYGYKKMYSLRGKNNFHKALVNSMAKDLKEPLTDLKTCSSALNDNIDTDKREYYAGEVLDEIRVINGLINKNLNLSKNNSYDLEEEEKIYFSDLVTDIKKKYEKLIEDKKLTIEQKGDTYLTGNPEVLKLMAEDIFSNVINSTAEGTAITIIGKNSSFMIKSRRDNPDKEADYSTAYGIIQERGWRMKMNYDKKKEWFVIKVILRKWI